jgi:hypothetical protein
MHYDVRKQKQNTQEKPRIYTKRRKEPKQPKGHLHYWFRSGTFINENNEEECLNLNVYLSKFFFKQKTQLGNLMLLPKVPTKLNDNL